MHGFQRFDQTYDPIRKIVLFKKRTNVLTRQLCLTELRHCWKQMVFDLKI